MFVACRKLERSYAQVGQIIHILNTTPMQTNASIIHLNSEFGGLAANLVAAAEHSAVKLVKLVLMHFPG